MSSQSKNTNRKSVTGIVVQPNRFTKKILICEKKLLSGILAAQKVVFAVVTTERILGRFFNAWKE